MSGDVQRELALAFEKELFHPHRGSLTHAALILAAQRELVALADELGKALSAAGLHVCSEGQAVVGGAVVTLVDVGMRVSAEQPDVARPLYEDEFSDYPTVPLFAAVPQVAA